MRTKSSMFNFIVKLLSSIIIGVLGIILNNLILTNFGSSLNGLWGTIGQVLNLLTILEGGLALSASVALYSPYIEKDTQKVSAILTATSKIYIKIGYIVTFLALIISFAAPYILESDVERQVIFLLFLISSASMSMQFFLVSRFNIMYSVGQKEYINNYITLIFNIISQIISIIAILVGGNILLVKFIAFLIPILRMPFVIKKHNKLFPNISFKSEKPDYSIVKSVKDVMALQFASLVFGSTDMIVISTMINTSYASVYSVYYMIYSFIKTFLTSLILAPFNAFGQLYATGDIDRLAKNYRIFQLITLIAINIFITTTNVLIVPFIKLYTINVHDINYVDIQFAMLFSFTFVLACIGDILSITNSTGHFREMKKVSIMTAIINLGLSLALVQSLGIKGVVIGTIVSYIIHFSLQTYIVYKKIIPYGFKKFLFRLIFNFLLSLLLIRLSFKVNLNFESYIEFGIVGLITFILVAIIILIINVLVDIKGVKEVYQLMESIIFKSKKYEN